jgi:hypothetical protein
MEEAPEDGKESSNSAHANGMNECMNFQRGKNKKKTNKAHLKLTKSSFWEEGDSVQHQMFKRSKIYWKLTLCLFQSKSIQTCVPLNWDILNHCAPLE